ncbi:MAG: ceramidase domain-containing protein [Marmoricola sp.]
MSGPDRYAGRDRDLLPLTAAVTAEVVSLVLMYLAARNGWLGADVGRGDGFCEAARAGLVRQPSNALSNLGFVVAGIAVGWCAGLPAGRLARPGLATAYAVVVVLLGPGSMAMHATQTELGGRLDQLSMYLISCFALAYAVVRATRRSTWFFLGLFAALLVVCETVEQMHVDLPVVDNSGNLVFAAGLVATIAIEVRLRRRGDRSLDVRWVVGAVGVIGVAFVIWNLSKDGNALCHPRSLLQGHAAWHLLCAVSAWCLYRYWSSDARVTGSP